MQKGRVSGASVSPVGRRGCSIASSRATCTLVHEVHGGAFKSPEAVQMWTDFKDIWSVVNPQSTSYANVAEPLQSEEIWIGWDHVAGQLDALNNRPNDFVTFPAPAGPKGRGYMPVLAGLAIPKGAPNQAGAEQLIDYLTQPPQQTTTAQQVGFFPATNVMVPTDLPPGVKLEASAIRKRPARPTPCRRCCRSAWDRRAASSTRSTSIPSRASS